MLKPVVTRNLMLDFISDEIICPHEINPNRILKLNEKKIGQGDIVYFMTREFRIDDNWGLLFAWHLAKENNRELKIIANLKEIAPSKNSNRQREFIESLIPFLKKSFERNGIEFEISEEIPLNAGAIVFDFNPLNLKTQQAKNLVFAAFEVDSHNIIPTRFISDKQEFSAATLRRKAYANIANFLTGFPQPFKIEQTEAISKLNDFIQNKLENYVELKNDPNKDATSNLSPYIHFGLISSQRVALEVLKSNAARADKESFLEELIVRKELSDNFCLYSKNYKSLDSILDWAKITLDNHRQDLRTYIYNLKEFEDAETHDELWNAAQTQLLETGKIHGYLRMYWAKKILEWSISPEEALKTAIYLNDEYALDGNDPNGYVGILWSIGGLHDRAFSERPTTGKIRYMSLGGCKKKFDVDEYIKNNSKI